MSLTRRQFIWTAAASGLLLPRSVTGQPDGVPFAHGVASGDPLAERVILWTRLTIPDREAVDVGWQIAHDPGLTQVTAAGTVRTTVERDFTVKVDATGLEPGRTYYYAFDVDGRRSQVGRTRTLPVGRVEQLRFGVVSCANYPAGYFNVYRCLARRHDLDAVIHLGDYIYEFPNGVFGDGTALDRIPEPRRESVSLDDYRLRYATYRADPDLQEVHRQHPCIAVWDDHEIANDAWSGGAANHNPADGEGDWGARLGAAYQAYLEWMPIRAAAGADVRLFRTFGFGSLVDLVMLDTRALRDRQVSGSDLAGLSNPNRTLLGADQEAWLFSQVRESQERNTAWRLLGQQVVFSPLSFPGRPVPLPDAWDGYQAARQRVRDFLARENINDVAILTGDLHSSWAFDVPLDPWDGYDARSGDGSLAVEFVTPAVSSPPLFADPAIARSAPVLRLALPHLKFLEGDSRGYLLVDITIDRLVAEWHHVPDVLERADTEVRAAAFVCQRGSRRLRPA